MRLLTHVCCAPCFLMPERFFREQGIKAAALFYNPNIHPFSEYERRLEVAEDFCAASDIDLTVAAYDPADYFRAVNFHETKPERCRHCYELRLMLTAETAKRDGFDAFTTSLLVSPYQLHDDLRMAGEAAAARTGIEFFYHDWRPSFCESVDLSRRLGMYRQNYCGCVFSERERILEKRAAKAGRKAVGG